MRLRRRRIMSAAFSLASLLQKETATDCRGSTGLIGRGVHNFFRGKDNEGFDSMIHFCTCSGGSASILEQTRKREVTESCKNCGGKPLVDGRGALPGSMLSTVGIELTRVIDPKLNWKTVSKSNKRGARRARASLTASNKKKHVAGSLKRSEDPIDKDLKGVEDMPVSESEKLGVSILGRRFSDIVESVPIKKRKFLLVRSPSPPPRTPSPRLEESECLLKSQSASNRKEFAVSSNVEQTVHAINTAIMAELGEADNAEVVDDEKYHLEEITKLGDNADFSGISILAAAACISNIGAGASNAEEGSFRVLQNTESSSVLEESCEKHLPNDVRTPEGKTDPNICVEMPVTRTTISVGTSEDYQKFSEGTDGTMITGSLSPEKSTDMSLDPSVEENGGAVGRVQSSSRDDRSHWDLNTVMDAWESPCDDPIVKANPEADIHEDGMHEEEEVRNFEHHQVQECEDTEDTRKMTVQHKVGTTVSNAVQEDACGFAESKLQDKHDFPCDSSVADVIPDKSGKASPSVPEFHEPVGEEQQLDSLAGSDSVTCSQEKVLSCEITKAPNSTADAAEETKHNQDQTSLNVETIHPPPIEHPPETGGVAEENAALCANIVCASEGEITSSHAVATGDISGDHTAHMCESYPVAVHITGNTMSKDNGEATPVDDVGNLSGDRCMTDAPTGEAIHPKSPQIEKGSGEIDGYSTATHSAEPNSPIPVDRNVSMTVDGMGIPIVEPEPSRDGSCNTTDQSKDSDVVGSCHSEPCEELSAANACVNQDTPVADAKTQDDRVSLVADGKMSVADMDSPAHKDSVHNSASATLAVTDAQLLVGSMVSPEAQRTNEGDHANISGEVALEDSFDGDYDSDGSQNDPDNAIVVETVSEHQADDDSQYEDGEFRESFVHSWEDDVGEEGEAERVDYGSDNIDTDAFEVAADYGASAPLQGESDECKKEASSELDRVPQAGDLIADENEQEAKHLSARRASLKTYVSAIDSGKRRALKVTRKVSTGQFVRKDGNEKLEMNGKVVADLGASSENVIRDDEFGTEGDATKELSHSALLRMKSTGWDQLPEVCKSAREAATDLGDHSIVRNPPGALLDSTDAGESLRRLVGSTSNRELSSRIEGPKSSDMTFRKDKIYVQGSRSHNLDDSNLRGERDAGPGRSIGRGGSSGHLRGRGRGGDHWLDSSGGHWGHKRHHSPGYYDSGDFAPPGPKNAAAAAAAKLESSGFLVAPNGTVVKSGSVGPTGRVHRRLANASSQSTHHSLTGRGSPTDRDGALRFGMPVRHGLIREMSPERSISAGRGRSGRYRTRVFATGQRERYNGHMPDDDIDSSLPMQHPMARRERSFSPIPRRAFHLSRSHTKSRSRSRTRSPHMWTSPRGRSGGINGGPGFRRHSRSPPNFRPEVRMERIRSPDRRPRFAAHMVGFVSASRSHGSPPHPSRWVDDRKDAPDHFREHEYKRSSASERSPPGRVFSRSHRFDIMGSPGRLKPDEYYRTMHSGRFPEFVVGRGPRHDGSDDDRRKHGERYGMVHSVRHYDMDGDVKRFRYDVGDGFRTHHSRTKNVSEFHGRGSPPRDYGRDIDSRLGNAPRRAREEKGHFRYDRDGKQNASFKTFGMRECDEDATPRRRRPS